MNDEKSFNALIDSIPWHEAQATALIKQYEACRTEHGRQLLIPKLRHIYSKLGFERRGLAAVINGIQ